MGFALLLLFADQVLRLIVAAWANNFLRIRVLGKNRINFKKPVLLVAPRNSWLDTVIVMTTLPRLIRYIVPIRKERKKRSPLYKLLCLIPIDVEHFSPIGPTALAAIRKELTSGNSACLMHPIDLPSASLKEWESKLEELLKDISVPIIPIYISKEKEVQKRGRLAQLNSLRHSVIKVSYGKLKDDLKPD
jgi:hypothetical protein